MTDPVAPPPPGLLEVGQIVGPEPPPPASQDLEVLALEELSEQEAGYARAARAARAANTLRGYRSDWREFTTWSSIHALASLPAAPATVTGYLTELADAGAKVGTMAGNASGLREASFDAAAKAS